MGWFTNLELGSLDDLFLVQLQDLYDAEMRLIDAIPKMALGAMCSDLKSALLQHLEETRGHVTRLEEIFRQMDVQPQRMTCEAMKGLIAEGKEVLSATGDPCVKDAAIISVAQKVEHYEIAGYGAVRTWALQLSRTRIAEMLQATLDEEHTADNILNEIAEETVNSHADRR